MTDSIERPPLPQAADGYVARPRAARETGPSGAADEPSPQQAVAMAVLMGPAAVPNSPAAAAAAQATAAATRGRHAVLVSRGASAAGQALAALARSVRTCLVEDTERSSDVGGDAGGGGTSTGDAQSSSAYASAPGWLVRGLQGTSEGRGMPGVDAASAARRAQAKPRTPAASPTPSRPPPLTSTAAIVRVRAPQRLQRGGPPRYWSALRIVSWGVALGGSIALASAYWLLAMYPHDDRDPAQDEAAEQASHER